MDELKRNGSGYYDPTAYKALQKIEREEDKMSMIKKGDIWTIESGGKEVVAVVIKTHGSYATVLTMADEPREGRNISLFARGQKYSDPGFISYKFNEGFLDFVRTTTDEEFEDIQKKIIERLGFDVKDYSITKEARAKIMELEAEVKDLNEILELRRVENEQLKYRSVSEDMTSELLVLKTQCEVYKEQYERLLERMIGK